MKTLTENDHKDILADLGPMTGFKSWMFGKNDGVLNNDDITTLTENVSLVLGGLHFIAVLFISIIVGIFVDFTLVEFFDYFDVLFGKEHLVGMLILNIGFLFAGYNGWSKLRSVRRGITDDNGNIRRFVVPKGHIGVLLIGGRRHRILLRENKNGYLFPNIGVVLFFWETRYDFEVEVVSRKVDTIDIELEEILMKDRLTAQGLVSFQLEVDYDDPADGLRNIYLASMYTVEEVKTFIGDVAEQGAFGGLLEIALTNFSEVLSSENPNDYDIFNKKLRESIAGLDAYDVRYRNITYTDDKDETHIQKVLVATKHGYKISPMFKGIKPNTEEGTKALQSNVTQIAYTAMVKNFTKPATDGGLGLSNEEARKKANLAFGFEEPGKVVTVNGSGGGVPVGDAIAASLTR